MYLIINSKDLISEISQHPCYVRKQDNGVVILSDEEHADAIYSNNTDSFYPLIPVGIYDESYRLVEVESVPNNVVAGYWFYNAGEYYTTEANLTALAKSEAPDLANMMFVSMAQEGKFDDATLTEHTSQFPKWVPSVNYTQGSICLYEDKLYRCVQTHTSQDDWTPDTAASLWTKIGDPTEEYPEWSQPIGAHDAYSNGDKVSYNSKHWMSECDNNVWEPGVYGWQEVD